MQQQQNAAAAAVDKNKLGKKRLPPQSPILGRGLEKHKNDEAATRIM